MHIGWVRPVGLTLMLVILAWTGSVAASVMATDPPPVVELRHVGDDGSLLELSGYPTHPLGVLSSRFAGSRTTVCAFETDNGLESAPAAIPITAEDIVITGSGGHLEPADPGPTVTDLEIFTGTQGMADGASCFSWASTAPGVQEIVVDLDGEILQWDTDGDGNGFDLPVEPTLAVHWAALEEIIVWPGVAEDAPFIGTNDGSIIGQFDAGFIDLWDYEGPDEIAYYAVLVGAQGRLTDNDGTTLFPPPIPSSGLGAIYDLEIVGDTCVSVEAVLPEPDPRWVYFILAFDGCAHGTSVDLHFTASVPSAEFSGVTGIVRVTAVHFTPSVFQITNPEGVETLQSVAAGSDDIAVWLRGSWLMAEGVRVFVRTSDAPETPIELDVTPTAFEALEVIIPSALLAAPGTLDVRVVTTGGESPPRPLFVSEAPVLASATRTVNGSATLQASAMVDGDDITISASATGTGQITVAIYGGNPGVPVLGSDNAYVDVWIASGSAFDMVVVEICGLDGDIVSFWDGSDWIVASNQSHDPATGCATIQITSSTVPSFHDLTGTVFALAHSAATLPTDINQCKKGGWQAFGDTFKNQGACVSFVATSISRPRGP